MKKFMKAIAFVTVMCMALSTVAFAAGTAELSETEKVLNITVTGAGNDQVALVVTASDAADFSNPLYIDQKGAVDGTASFTAVLTNYSGDAVDVYVGYATYAATGATAPEKIGEDVAITNPVTEVTISNFAGAFTENVKALEQTGTGAYVTFDVVAPEGTYASHMIWAIRYEYVENGETKTAVKYSDKFDVSGYGIGSLLGNGIKLGLAFLNGSDLNNIDPVTITAVDAIFLFTDDSEVLTNPADAANRK